MSRNLVEAFFKVLYALIFSAIPAVSLYGIDNPKIVGCITCGIVMFIGHLVLLRANDILEAIEKKK